MPMINEFRNQSKETIIQYLRNRLADPTLYTIKQQGLGPMMPLWETYILADPREVVIVAIDPCHLRQSELADEEAFNDEFPQYFSESTHRGSPVFKLAITCNMMENHLERLIFKRVPRVWGVLLTGIEIINYDDMSEVWNNLNISVFHNMEGLQRLKDMVVNCPEHLPHNVPPVAFACEVGFSEDNVKDALRKLGKRLGTEYSFAPTISDFELEPLEKDSPSDEADNDGEKPSICLRDFGFDDDYDLNDDVDEDNPFPDEADVHVKTSWKELYEGNRLMQNVASVSFNLPTSCFTPLYTFGPTTVILSPEKGYCLAKDRFKCFIYTKDCYPMCSSVEGGCVHISEDDSLEIEMYCSHVWLPGEYVLLIRDNDELVGRYDFTLDENLKVSMGELKRCLPCSVEDVLTSSMDHDDNWAKLSHYPGVGKLREYAINSRQLAVYNTYRTSLKADTIGSNMNLLICTRNNDLDELFFRCYCDFLFFGGRHLNYIDCSGLYDSSRLNPYESLNDEFSNMKRSVICLNGIGALLNASGKIIVRKVLEKMRKKDADNLLWLCGCSHEIDSLLNLYPSLGEFYLSRGRLEQEPYRAFDLVQGFYSQLCDESMGITLEVADTLARALLQSHRQGLMNCWSLKSIRKFIVEEIRPHYLDHALSSILSDNLTLLSKDDLCLDKLTKSTSSFEESMRELDEMIGLKTVKEGIRTMANQARLYLERRRMGLKTSENMVFHSIFLGNPGTGKTTVARMLGKIYHSLGLLSKGEVIAVDRTRLVGQYIGQTEDNMKIVLEEARGNVLFIDEAYTLYTDSDDKRDYGARVIESLMTVLSQPNPDMLIVFAGYPREMEDMLSSNPGLMGRFPYRYLFPDYNAKELMQIARKLFDRDEYILTDEAVVVLEEVIEKTLRERPKNFSNARWIDHLVKNGVIPAFADRVFATGSDDFQHIEPSDIRTAYEKLTPKPIELLPRHKVVAGFSS